MHAGGIMGASTGRMAYGVAHRTEPCILCLQEGDQGLTVQCALEGNCVLLRRDTLLSEALSLLDEAEQSVALVVCS